MAIDTTQTINSPTFGFAKETPMIYQRISAIMRDIEAIGKDRQNKIQNYAFRGIDDVYNMCHPILAKHEVFSVPTVLSQKREEKGSKSGGTLFYTIIEVRYDFFTTDGSFITTVVVGEAMDSGDKSTNKAMSAAQKYAFLQIFCIPTKDEKDVELDSPTPQYKAKKDPAAKVNPESDKNRQAVDAAFADDMPDPFDRGEREHQRSVMLTAIKLSGRTFGPKIQYSLEEKLNKDMVDWSTADFKKAIKIIKDSASSKTKPQS